MQAVTLHMLGMNVTLTGQDLSILYMKYIQFSSFNLGKKHMVVKYRYLSRIVKYFMK